MSTPLPVIDLSTAIVGGTGKIDLTACAPTSHPAFATHTATLVLYNESGVGLRLSGKTTGLSFDLPAGGWIPQAIPAGETEIDYVVLYILPNAPVKSLLATYYQPNEPVISAVLGNSPVGIGGLTVPLVASSVANDGNASGTEFVESSISSVKHISMQNQGVLIFTPTLSGANAAPLEIHPTDAGAKDYQILYIQSDNELQLRNITDNIACMQWFFGGGGATAGANIQWDSSGNITAGTDTLRSGIQESGHYIIQITDTAISAWGTWIRFRKKMTNVPSSITLSNITSTNINAQSATNISTDGFEINLTMTATGSFSFICDWATVGN